MYEQDIEHEIALWTIRYLHRDISNNDLVKLNKWLQESPANKETLYQLKIIHDSIHSHKLLSKEESDVSWQKMEHKMELAVVSQATNVRRNTIIRSLKYIAVAAVASVLGLLINPYSTKQSDLSATPAHVEKVSYNEIRVGKGGKPNNILLSDGTDIQLNVAGTLRYPTNFSSTNREVFLDGEARFDVATDNEKPFIVHLQYQTIMVYGTSFNVEAYRDESIHKVTLLNGSISLETQNSEGERISQINLKPGQKASFDITSGVVAVENVDASVADIWIQGEYKFKDEALKGIARRLEKNYDVTLLLDNDLKNIRYTGTLSFDQSIEQVLRIITYDKKIAFRKNGNTIYLSKIQ